jgi:uroporphyrinogen III methyltransferase/synthase
MTFLPNSRTLSGRTVLVSPNETQSELNTKLSYYGARVLAWPTLDIGEPENYQSLNEAIENLFGYDWLIFQNEDAVDFFLSRFQRLAHEISELDALRVCAAGEGAAQKLEASQVHIDVIPDLPSARMLFEAIGTYVGGREAMRGLNFLVPSAAIARDRLEQLLEEVGARIDTVTAFRTVAHGNATLGQLNAVLAGGGIDCIVFNGSSDVLNFARLFGTNDLPQLLTEATVACADLSACHTAADFGLPVDLRASDPGTLAEIICRHLGKA